MIGYLRGRIKTWHRRWCVRQLLRTHGAYCAYCGCGLTTEIDDARQLTLDHRIPKSHGGSSRLVNLALCCATCNRRKGSMSALEYYTSQRLISRIISINAEKRRHADRASS